MKSYFLLSWAFLSVVFAQTKVPKQLITDSNVKLKKGIYTSFEEFKNNAPSIQIPYTVKSKIAYAGLYSDPLLCHKLVMSDSAKDIFDNIKSVWGFCDGEHIYIREFRTLNKTSSISTLKVKKPSKSKYYSISYLGRFCTTTSLVFSTDRNDKVPMHFIIDINDGMIIQLTMQVVEKIIKNDSQLSKEFESENKKKNKLVEYIIAYCKKHPEEIER